mgnify:FL=1
MAGTASLVRVAHVVGGRATTCRRCGWAFITTGQKHYYCKRRCERASTRARKRERRKPEFGLCEAPGCGVRFDIPKADHSPRATRRFCKKSCRTRDERARAGAQVVLTPETNCLACGKFLAGRTRRAKYCDTQCKSSHQTAVRRRARAMQDIHEGRLVVRTRGLVRVLREFLRLQGPMPSEFSIDTVIRYTGASRASADRQLQRWAARLRGDGVPCKSFNKVLVVDWTAVRSWLARQARKSEDVASEDGDA